MFQGEHESYICHPDVIEIIVSCTKILKERDFEMNLMDSVIEGRTKVQTQT